MQGAELIEMVQRNQGFSTGVRAEWVFLAEARDIATAPCFAVVCVSLVKFSDQKHKYKGLEAQRNVALYPGQRDRWRQNRPP